MAKYFHSLGRPHLSIHTPTHQAKLQSMGKESTEKEKAPYKALTTKQIGKGFGPSLSNPNLILFTFQPIVNDAFPITPKLGSDDY